MATTSITAQCISAIPAFTPALFLASAGLGRKLVHIRSKQTFFTQGDRADCVFYVQSGRAKLTVVSKEGKEATITLISAGQFVGEEALMEHTAFRRTTATAITPCLGVKIEHDEMVRVLHEEKTFSDLFLQHLVSRTMRTQADLVDQLFNSSERRLARALLILADYDTPGEPSGFIAPITQEALAGMVGTTRSRISFFMNRFRKLGFISYHGRIQVHKSLLNVFLHDQLPEQHAMHPVEEAYPLLSA
ncbi:Crp/Fnr family transcriptional regulator [soil metagenome]